MPKWTIVFLLLVIIGATLMVLSPEESSAESTRSSYGVVLKVIDQPYFPREGKWTDFLNITVTNTSPDKSDTFRLEATQRPQGWDVIVLEPTIDVGTSPPTGPEKSTTLLISCPKMEKQGIYRIAIKGTSQGDPTQYHVIYIDVQVMLVPLVSVEGPINVEDTDIDPANGIPDYREGDPGDYVTYDFQIRNIGNGEEAYFISLVSPNNWWHEIQGPSFTQTLGINQTAIKRVKVKIPDNAKKDDSDVLKFIASSQVDPEIHHLASVETKVKQIFSLGLEAPIYSTFSYPHSEVELDFNITNEGNGDDGTARMEMKSISPDWIWEFDLSDIGVNGIQRYGKARCVLSLVIPETALNRTYTISIETYSSLKQLPDDSITFNITVFQEFDLNLTQKTNSIKVFPGEMITYNFSVENSGNGEDNYSIQLQKGGDINVTSWCELDTRNVEMGNGFSHEIFFYVRIPEMSRAGKYIIGIQVVSTGAREMQLVIEETLSFSFEIMKQYSLKMTGRIGDEILSINSDETDPEKRLDLFQFNVSNLGNAQDILLFTIDYPEKEGWRPPDFMISQVMLQYRETRGNLILTVRAPFGIAIGEYHFTVHVTSTKDPSENPASDSIDFIVKIVRFDIEIDKIISLDSHLVDSSENISSANINSIELKIWVRNVGNLDIDRFNVSLYINDERIAPYRTREIFDFKSEMNKELSFDFSPSTYSTYRFFFIVDPGGIISEMNESNNRVVLTYIVREANEGYLFSMLLEDCGGLNPGPVSDKLKNCFSLNDINLSKRAVISSDKENEWKVTDGSVEYRLSITGSEMVVYHVDQNSEGNDSPLLLILEILGAVIVLVIVATIVIRISRSRRKDPLIDTGLVEGEEYKFHDRGIKPEFDGLELDDFFEGMEGDTEKEKKKEDTIKDEGTGYFVSGQDQVDSGGTDLGFTIYKPPSKITGTTSTQRSYQSEWEEQDSAIYMHEEDQSVRVEQDSATYIHEEDQSEWKEKDSATDMHEEDQSEREEQDSAIYMHEEDQSEWKEKDSTTDMHEEDQSEWEEKDSTTYLHEGDRTEWEEHDTSSETDEAQYGEWGEDAQTSDGESKESVESDQYEKSDEIPIPGESVPMDEDHGKEEEQTRQSTPVIPERKQYLMLKPKSEKKETEKARTKKPLMMKPVSGPVVSRSKGENDKLDDLFGILRSPKSRHAPRQTSPVVPGGSGPGISKQVGRPMMKPRDRSMQTSPAVKVEASPVVQVEAGNGITKQMGRPMMKPRTSPRRPSIKPRTGATPTMRPVGEKERPKMKPVTKDKD